MVAKVMFWLLERSRLIDNDSFSVMILKYSFLYSLLTTRMANLWLGDLVNQVCYEFG